MLVNPTISKEEHNFHNSNKDKAQNRNQKYQPKEKKMQRDQLPLLLLKKLK
jgi:hypothetical protein